MLLLLHVVAGFDTPLNGEYAFSHIFFSFSSGHSTYKLKILSAVLMSFKTAPVVAYRACARRCFILVSMLNYH